MPLTIISTRNGPAAIGPYNQAVVAPQSLIYTAGQIPLDPVTGEIVAGDIGVQTRRVLENLRIILEAGGSGLDLVVKTTVFMKDLGEFAAMNVVYAEFFTHNAPARSTIEVARLPRDARVEIEAVAVVRGV
jgi:2-iminobutanoate/2-iminopropanoate deaminase